MIIKNNLHCLSRKDLEKNSWIDSEMEDKIKCEHLKLITTKFVPAFNAASVHTYTAALSHYNNFQVVSLHFV